MPKWFRKKSCSAASSAPRAISSKWAMMNPKTSKKSLTKLNRKTLPFPKKKYMKKDFVPIKSILEIAFNRIDELHKSDHAFRGVQTFFPDIDNLLAGLQKSDLLILAALPSVGKTALALDIARQIGVHSKVPVGIFSLEMSSDQLVDRMIAAQAGVDLWRLRTGKLSSEGQNNDFERI